MYTLYGKPNDLKEIKRKTKSHLDKISKILKKEGISGCFELVGSAKNNIVTINDKKELDLDYNLRIDKCTFISDAKKVKELTFKTFDKYFKEKNLGIVKDSTSVITTSKGTFDFSNGNKITYYLDICICDCVNKPQTRLIHDKKTDHYFYNQSINLDDIQKKVKKLKEHNYWNKFKETYVDKKNMYLKNEDNNHPSYICYIETANELYKKYFQK